MTERQQLIRDIYLMYLRTVDTWNFKDGTELLKWAAEDADWILSNDSTTLHNSPVPHPDMAHE